MKHTKLYTAYKQELKEAKKDKAQLQILKIAIETAATSFSIYQRAITAQEKTKLLKKITKLLKHA